MTASTFLPPGSANQNLRTFARRALLPLERDYLWRIETGVVRTVTWNEDGAPITLGLWKSGDIAGRALSKFDPYQIECLTDVEATRLPVGRWHEVSEAMIVHVQQLQELLEIQHCKAVELKIVRVLSWLANRFGREIEQGQLIDLRLTHQDIAQLIGTTRVTVTRALNEFEKRGIIQRLRHSCIVLHEQQPFWHYEI